MKKKLMSVLLAAAMVAATAVPAFAADTVKIGVYEPASGDNGAGGKQETLGIQYANSGDRRQRIYSRTGYRG